MKKYYQTLGLNEGASQEEIQTTYDRLSKELDPKNNDHQEFFVEEYKKICEAYDALSNSTILATERGSELSNTTKISTEENNREPNNNNNNNNSKDLKSVKNWKGYFVFIFFLLVGFGPSTVVYYYTNVGKSYKGYIIYSEITRAEFQEMDLFNQSLYCFKQSIVDVDYRKNYFLFIFIFIVILFIFLLFQKNIEKKLGKLKKNAEKKMRKLKSEEALEKIGKYKKLVDLDIISKEEYTNLVKEYRSMLLKDIEKE